MTPFAGYELPVNYSGGIIAEHLFTRENAGLFDVSHMGQAFLSGADAARKFESLVPGDICGWREGRIRYTQFTNEDGGDPRRPDGHEACARRRRRKAFPGGQRRLQGCGFRAVGAKACPTCGWKSWKIAPCSPCKGLARRACWSATSPASRKWSSCPCGNSTGVASALFVTRSGLYAARTASRSRSRRLDAVDFADGAAGRGGSPRHRPRRPRFAAARSGTLPLWP